MDFEKNLPIVRYQRFLTRKREKALKKLRVYQCASYGCQNICKPAYNKQAKYCCERCAILDGKRRYELRKREKERTRRLSNYELNFLKNLKILRGFSGVYFLYLKGELRYIGSSKNIHFRIYQHTDNSKFEWDEFKYVKCNVSKMRELERRFIDHFDPPYNIMKKAKVFRD